MNSDRLRAITPASFQSTISANTRTCSVTERFRHPFYVLRFRPSFALNTQRNLRIRFFITDEATFPDDTGSAARGATGTNLLADYGVQDYIVGDGEEGEKDIPINRWFPDGKRICVDAHNLDASNPHTLDLGVDLLDATPLSWGESIRGAA